jgi:cell division protein FtsN
VPALTGTQAGGPAAGVSAKGFFSTTPATDAKAARAAGAITKGAAVSDRSKPYTIIVGTFSKKETAQAASAYLMKEGFQASVSYIQPYYRVTVGSYADQDGPSVQKDLARVRRVYKNASIGQK